jgi:hypothetical protein
MNIPKTFSNKLKTNTFIIESVDQPIIKAGGSSSSTLLNRYHSSIVDDLVALNITNNQLGIQSIRISETFNAQSQAINPLLASLSARVGVLASGSPLVLADFYSAKYVSSDPLETVAEIDKVFGQITLPVLKETDLLVDQDSFGNFFTSDEVNLSFSYEDNPDTAVFIDSSDAIKMLLREQVWLGTLSAPVWIKLTAPLQFLGLNPNVLEIYPLPSWGTDISNIQYQIGGIDQPWVDADVSYLPRYKATNNKLANCGPIKIHLPGDPIYQIRFKITPNTDLLWGLYNIRVISKQYSQTGKITLQDPYSRNINGITVRGKDPQDLAQLSNSTSTGKLTINLSSDSVYKTPVITGVVMEF